MLDLPGNYQSSLINGKYMWDLPGNYQSSLLNGKYMWDLPGICQSSQLAGKHHQIALLCRRELNFCSSVVLLNFKC